MSPKKEQPFSSEQGTSFGDQMREQLKANKDEVARKREDVDKKRLFAFDSELSDLSLNLRERLEEIISKGRAKLVVSPPFYIDTEDIEKLSGYSTLIEVCRELDVRCRVIDYAPRKESYSFAPPSNKNGVIIDIRYPFE